MDVNSDENRLSKMLQNFTFRKPKRTLDQ